MKLRFIGKRLILAALLLTSHFSLLSAREGQSTYTLFSEPSLFDRKLNVEVMPVWILTGQFRADVTFDVSDHNSFGLIGSLRQASWSKERFEGETFGVVASHRIYDRTVSSPFIRMELERGAVRRKAVDKNGVKEESWDFPFTHVRGLVGYSWLWANGLNASLGAGAGYVNGDLRSDQEKLEVQVFRAKVEKGPISIIYPDLELSLGYKI